MSIPTGPCVQVTSTWWGGVTLGEAGFFGWRQSPERTQERCFAENPLSSWGMSAQGWGGGEWTWAVNRSIYRHMHGALSLGICSRSVAWSCPTFCNPIDCSPSGSSVHGIVPVRILKWVAISSSRGSSQPRDGTYVSFVSCIDRQALYLWHHPEQIYSKH